MVSYDLTPDEKFLFIEVLDRSAEGMLDPDLTPGSEEYLLTEKLDHMGWVDAPLRADGKIHDALLLPAGKVAAQEIHRWVKEEGREGEVQIELYTFFEKTSGECPTPLIGREIRGEAITEDELSEAVDALEKAGAITIPNGTSNGGAHGLPLRVSPVRSWKRKIDHRKPPAWHPIQEVASMNNNFGHYTTNNFSQVSNSQIAVGDYASQNQTNNHGLSDEAIQKIVDYFNDFRKQVQENITDIEQRQVLLKMAKEAECQMKESETPEEAKSWFTKFAENTSELIAKHGAESLSLLLVEGISMATGLPVL